MRTLLMIGAAAGGALIAGAAALAQPAAQAAAPAHTRAAVQAAVAQHFARIDTNRDGYVTRAEADAVRSARAGQRGNRAAKRATGNRDGAGMFERLDTNRNGSISRAEFDAHRAHRQQRVAARDQNRDGRPDARGMGGLHRFAALRGRMFETADANRDGRVSLQEATGAALQHFDMADANRDGQVTREERRQMHQRMRAQRRPG